MRRKYLEEYEEKIGPITGVDRDEFDNASKNQILEVTCACGEVFDSQKRLLAERFRRGFNIRCRSCANIAGGITRSTS